MTNLLHKKYFKAFVGLLFYLSHYSLSFSQNYGLSIVYVDSISSLKSPSFHLKTKQERITQLKVHLNTLQQQGYLLAEKIKTEFSIDSLNQTVFYTSWR